MEWYKSFSEEMQSSCKDIEQQHVSMLSDVVHLSPLVPYVIENVPTLSKIPCESTVPVVPCDADNVFSRANNECIWTTYDSSCELCAIIQERAKKEWCFQWMTELQEMDCSPDIDRHQVHFVRKHSDDTIIGIMEKLAKLRTDMASKTFDINSEQQSLTLLFVSARMGPSR